MHEYNTLQRLQTFKICANADHAIQQQLTNLHMIDHHFIGQCET